MGGNALKSTVRLLAHDYYVVASLVESKLKLMFSEVSVIPSYANKESFGDLDILVNIHGVETKWVDLVRTHFKPDQLIKNGNVVSFSFPVDYKVFQVDLIASSAELFKTSLFYFSYNDFGNLLGRLSHKLGLKFGHTGLHYVVRDSKVQGTQEILITRDPSQILAILGLSYERYSLGFKTLDEIFNYVSSSKFFNPDIYLLDNLNHGSRIRDRKRETYRKFLEWCANTKLNHYEFPDPDKEECEGKTELVKAVTERVRNQVKDLGILIEGIYLIGEFRLPNTVITAINAKIEATQKAQQRENEIRQAEAEAKKKIEDAKGTAQSILEIAEAQAKANKILAESLTPELVNYKTIERWDGVLPKMTGSTVPFVKLD